jgi:hypothetical protein
MARGSRGPVSVERLAIAGTWTGTGTGMYRSVWERERYRNGLRYSGKKWMVSFPGSAEAHGVTRILAGGQSKGRSSRLYLHNIQFDQSLRSSTHWIRAVSFKICLCTL